MNRPKFPSVLGIALIGLLLLALLLPVSAGLIEGDFGYMRWEFNRGWLNEQSLLQSLDNVYAWSFWRIGLREQPVAYLIYVIIQPVRPNR